MKKMAILLFAISIQAQANPKFNATATSDYVWRGQSQTNNKSAIQGGLDYEPLAGATLGVWSSSVEGGAEVDLIAKYMANINDSVQLGIGGTFYYYTKNSNANTPEVNLILNTPYVGVTANYMDDYFGTGTNSWYFEAGQTFTLNEEKKLKLYPVLGYVMFDDEGKSGSKDHLNYRLELQKDVETYTFKVFYTDTNRKLISSGVETSVDDESIGVALATQF